MWCGLVIPGIVDSTDYYQSEALKHDIKFVRIVKRELNGRTRYYAQLVLKGFAPPILDGDGSFKHQTRDLKVGTDLNVSNLAFVAEDGEAGLMPFAEGVPSYEKEISALQRKMPRSQRASNPDCFEPDFDKKVGRKTVRKKGKFKKGKRAKNQSRAYKVLARRKRELERRKAAYSQSQNRRLVNVVLSKGKHISTENVSVKGWQKRWGKAISAKSPGFFQSELIRKAENAGGSVTKFSTHKTACSQTHLDGERRKKSLSERVHEDVTGPILHRDLFSAFLALCVEDDQLPGGEDLQARFSGMERFLLRAWQDSSEYEQFSKLKPLVEARLASCEARPPQRESALNEGPVDQVFRACPRKKSA